MRGTGRSLSSGIAFVAPDAKAYPTQWERVPVNGVLCVSLTGMTSADASVGVVHVRESLRRASATARDSAAPQPLRPPSTQRSATGGNV